MPTIWDSLIKTSKFNERKEKILRENKKSPIIKKGIGITPVKFGISFTLKHYNQAGALILIYQDGSIQINHGGTEMGQGLHTKMARIGMEEFGLSKDKIRLMHTQTDKVPNTSATAASCGADLNGMAILNACQKLKTRLKSFLINLWKVSSQSTICFKNGKVFFEENPKKKITFSELVLLAYLNRIQLSATGFYKTPDIDWDWDTKKGRPFFYFAFGAAVSEVIINTLTGESKIQRVDILHDTGDSLNPNIDKGQIEGAFIQGAGWLTKEELKWNEEEHGILMSHSASTYAIPSFADIPAEFNVELLKDSPQNRTIYKSKAVGEPPFVLGISVREAIRHAVLETRDHCSRFNLPSPATIEAIYYAIRS